MLPIQRDKSRIILMIVTIIIALALLGGGAWFAVAHQKKQKELTSEDIIVKVSAIYELPTREVPTVAKIRDVRPLQSQPFYDNAKTGDYLLAYQKSKLALLYRVSTGKLINVQPILVQDNDSTKK